jgi:hypothetical protein
VQCIHTSNYPGSEFQSGCHQNWRLGNCGHSQPGMPEPIEIGFYYGLYIIVSSS